MSVRSFAHAFAGFSPAAGEGGVTCGSKNVWPLTFTFRTLTVCSLSSNAQPESTTIERPVTWYDPTSASACAYVDTCVPGCTWLVSKRPSVEPIRLPDAIHMFWLQPVKLGAGPRYTNTFFSPEGVWTRTWKRGEPALQSSSVTLNSAESVVMLENVVTPVPVNVAPDASFVAPASPVLETSVRIPPLTVAPPNGVAVAATAAGARIAAQTSTTAMMIRRLM
jgi:hypothetical protein